MEANPDCKVNESESLDATKQFYLIAVFRIFHAIPSLRRTLNPHCLRNPNDADIPTQSRRPPPKLGSFGRSVSPLELGSFVKIALTQELGSFGRSVLPLELGSFGHFPDVLAWAFEPWNFASMSERALRARTQ